MAIISRITRGTCRCGFDGPVCFHLRSGWSAVCPGCRKRLIKPKDMEQPKTYGNRRFTESEGESVRHGFHPAEVKVARRMVPTHAGCIRDDGRVVFEDSKQAASYERELAKAQDRAGVPHKLPWE